MKRPEGASATPLPELLTLAPRPSWPCADAPVPTSPLLSGPEALGVTGMNKGAVYGLEAMMTAAGPQAEPER